MRVVHLLTSGVDTIHASAPGALRPGLRQELGELRGQTGADGSMVDLGDNPEGFILKPHGWRGYPIWLRSARIELMLGAVDPFPPVFVQWHSPFIHAYGVETAVAMVEGWLDEAVMEVRGPLRASRLDLYCDFQGWIPTVRDLSDFSCRATRRRVFEVPRQAHLSGRSFSGFTFGKGDVVCRIYDKSLEMAGRDQHRQEEIWRGRDPEQPVWRVEFQFRRQALRAFGLETLEQALGSRQGLWEYGMGWISLRRTGKDSNRSRWHQDPVWSELRQAEIGSPSSPLVRRRVRTAAQDRLLRGFIGYASALGALSTEDDLEAVLRTAGYLATRHLQATGRDFGGLVDAKRDRLRALRMFRVTPQLIWEVAQ